jgi:uncharacterized protein (DUF885 family)
MASADAGDVGPLFAGQRRIFRRFARAQRPNQPCHAAGAAGQRQAILCGNLVRHGENVAQEQAQLPAFRRFDFTNAYGEGWALYSESLGNELGLFDDPWNYYGHLNYAILRANRLVIDTGLHAMGWDVDTGVRWMLEHSSMTRDQAAAEVERYVAYPGQALSYKLGELKIRELRQRAVQELGSKFDIKAFHGQILLGGSMPLTILEQNVDRWISAARPR